MPTARVVRAQNRTRTKAEAVALGDQGMAAMQRKDYKAAAALFEAADRRMHSPMFLVFRARALEKQGKLIEAEAVLTSVLKERARGPGGRSVAFRRARKMARSDRKSLRAAIPRVRFRGASGLIQIDGRAVESLRRDAKQRVMLNPGRYTVVFSVGVEQKRGSLELERGERKELDLAAWPKSAADGDQPSPNPRPDKAISWAWPIGSYVLGGAGLIVGTILGVQYLQARDAFSEEADAFNAKLIEKGCLKSTYPFANCDGIAFTAEEEAKGEELSERRAALEVQSVLAPVVLGVGVVGVVVGTVLTIQRVKADAQTSTGGASRHRRRRIAWEPWIVLNPQPARPVLMGLRGRF